MIDKSDWFWNPERMTWAEAQRDFPAMPRNHRQEIRSDSDIESACGRSHLQSEEWRIEQWDDTPTEDLISGIERAMKYIEKRGDIFKVESANERDETKSSAGKSKNAGRSNDGNGAGASA